MRAKQKAGKVLPFPNSQYAQWRRESGAAPFLRENGEPPPERLLQAVWQHQRLQRDQLKTLDGETVRVLHPGFLNREGGPDFRAAVVQWGSAPARSGDVEVDLQAAGWRAHAHDRNPAFRNVILHVLWEGTPGAAMKIPSLAIRDCLDAPIEELALWLTAESLEFLPEDLRGRCAESLMRWPAARRGELLREAAQIRFQSKAAQLLARARQVGWEQALWEGMFRALGYKHNAWPMQCLAELRPRWLLPRSSPLALQSRLLGIGNLLPGDLTRKRPAADGYLRRVWDQWWREREEFGDCLLPRSLWRFHGQRPANHPQRRLALAAHWLSAGDLARKITAWCVRDISDERLPASLLEMLDVGQDAFWSWHWTVHSARMKSPRPLLGLGRVTDLAVNVVLPWLWLRAAEGKNANIRQTVERRFQSWPAGEDNAVLRLARQRLLGAGRKHDLQSAAEQQGLMQVVRDFCEHSNAICENCRFPELLTGSQA